MFEKYCKNGIEKCAHGHLSNATICGCVSAEVDGAVINEKSNAKLKPCPELKQVTVDELPTDLPISQQEILMLLDALKAEIDDLLAL